MESHKRFFAAVTATSPAFKGAYWEHSFCSSSPQAFSKVLESMPLFKLRSLLVELTYTSACNAKTKSYILIYRTELNTKIICHHTFCFSRSPLCSVMNESMGLKMTLPLAALCCILVIESCVGKRQQFLGSLKKASNSVASDGSLT